MKRWVEIFKSINWAFVLAKLMTSLSSSLLKGSIWVLRWNSISILFGSVLYYLLFNRRLFALDSESNLPSYQIGLALFTLLFFHPNLARTLSPKWQETNLDVGVTMRTLFAVAVDPDLGLDFADQIGHDTLAIAPLQRRLLLLGAAHIGLEQIIFVARCQLAVGHAMVSRLG